VRLDVVSIFPDYLAPLELSLIGTARRSGLLDLRVHDLRDFTHDRHRTVDDTPYGGGAGMVMRPQPWAEALDSVASSGEPGVRPRLVVPGPGGTPFTQALARELAAEPWLAFACGRYEGIDERVYEHAAEDLGLEVSVVSLGDYVLNGGEVAVLAIVEAVARLLPGVIGNAESLVEESHEDGLLEYPVYTKPASWAWGERVRDVPPVLLSGNHAAIAAWRQQQRLERTAARRPDLLHASAALGEGQVELRPAVPADAGELLTLQRAAFAREVDAHGHPDFPALTEELDDVVSGLGQWRTVVAHVGGRLVGSARGRAVDGGTVWEVSRVMVVPDLTGRGLGRQLLEHVESLAPAEVREHRLQVAAGSERNRRLYRKAGYRQASASDAVAPEVPGCVVMVKRRR
jgi:tRNA (guanine37-N1)-methyltransferase